MSPEERQMLADLFERVRSNGSTPRDPQAETFINDAVRATPYAPYVFAQTVLVQQNALEAAAKRIADLEAQVQSLSRSAAPQQETSFLGGLGRSLFGGGSTQAPPPPPRQSGYDSSAYQRGPTQAPPPYASAPPQYAPAPQGPWAAAAAPAGGGFLSGALKTAAGVAGGVVLANTLEGMLGGHGGGGMFGGGGGLFGGGGMSGGGETVVNETVNNVYEAPSDAGYQPSDDVVPDQDAGWDAGGSNDDSFDT